MLRLNRFQTLHLAQNKEQRMSNLARPFSKNDWCGFAGAESWSYETLKLTGDLNHQPIIREFPECGLLVTADVNGAEVYFADQTFAQYCHPFPTQKAAMAFLNGLPDEFVPEQYGFVRY